MANKKIWEDNYDYMASMNKKDALGDFKGAAEDEVKRNAKIDYLNETGTNTGNWQKTYDYQGWLEDTDYSAQGLHQIDTKAPTWVVKESLNNHYNKASGTKGMEQYLNNDATKAMIDYIAQNEGGYNDILHSRPTHESKNDAKIDEMYDKIMNREAFSYNAESDPLYQQYAEMYRREGDRAMRNTLAEVAMGAGGMNSYAITAAQQANDYYNQKLADKIPELYQLAYSMYLDEGNRMRDDLGLLIDMENNDYNRYLNDLGQWNNDLSFAYGREQDALADEWKRKTWDYQIDSDAKDDTRQDKADAREWVEFLISRNVTPSQQDLDAAGLTPEQYEQLKNWYYNQNFTTGGRKGGRKSGSNNNDDDDSKEMTFADSGALKLGIGSVSAETLLQLAEMGAIQQNSNGDYEWINGWNKNNYKNNANVFSGITSKKGEKVWEILKPRLW